MSSAFLLGEVPFFHDRVSAIALSPTQPVLASVGWDGALRLFDCDTGRERLALQLGSGWSDSPMDVSFSPDGAEMLVAAGLGHSVRRWSCADWRELPPIAVDRFVSSVAVSADGGTLVIGVSADNFPEPVVGVLVCERSGTVRHRLSLDQMGSGFVAVAVNADATRVAALAVDEHWDESQQLKIWELPSERVLHEEFEATYQSDAWLSVDPTGSWLVTKTRGTVLFDFRDGQVVGELDDSDRAVFLPDGRLARCRFDELVVSEADGSHPRSATLAPGSGISGLAAAQWGPVLAVARGSSVALLSTDTLARRFPEALCTKTLALAFSGDGTQLYAAGEGERVIHLFDVRTRACLSRISFPDAWPNGVFFPVGLGPERSVCLHGAYAHRTTATALDGSSTDLGERVDLGQAAFSTDARYALALVRRDPMLINLESGRRESIALPGRRERSCLALGSGASRVAFETKDGLVVRDASSPWILARLPSHPELALLAFSPDGTRLAVVRHGQELEVWDVAAQRVERTVPVPPGYPTAAAFSADNARIAIGSTTGVVTVEELRPGARE